LTYGNKGEFDKAIADYDESIRLDPKQTEAYNGRVVCIGKKATKPKPTRISPKPRNWDTKRSQVCGTGFASVLGLLDVSSWEKRGYFLPDEAPCKMAGFHAC